MIKVILAAIILILLAVAGLGIKLIFDRNAEFTGSSCSSTSSPDGDDSGELSCGCGGRCN